MLAVCLAALARQTRPADEVIVVDNGSTDNTADVCAAAGARRIAVAVPGIAASTAAGFDAARSGVIARLDADSVPPADWLERVEAILDQAGPLTAVSGPGDFYGGTRVARWLGRNVYIAGYFWAIGCAAGPSAAVRVQLRHAGGGLGADPRLGQPGRSAGPRRPRHLLPDPARR